MEQSDRSVRFLYKTRFGRLLLRLILATHADRLAAAFLRSRLSAPYGRRFAAAHGITLDPSAPCRSYRDVFLRSRADPAPDAESSHLISPCDSLLSVFPVSESSKFCVKGQYYRMEDLIEDPSLAASFAGGLCLIFRLRPQDYHRFCFCDSGSCGQNHYVEGTLHSVQPAACSTYPVYALNRRVWTLLETDHFGPIVQTEVGALIVGGIRCLKENARFEKGEEMGWFDLAGSSIVLFVQKGRVRLSPEVAQGTQGSRELQVQRGMWIAERL